MKETCRSLSLSGGVCLLAAMRCLAAAKSYTFTSFDFPVLLIPEAMISTQAGRSPDMRSSDGSKRYGDCSVFPHLLVVLREVINFYPH
jgi:hypothetical protein